MVYAQMVCHSTTQRYEIMISVGKLIELEIVMFGGTSRSERQVVRVSSYMWNLRGGMERDDIKVEKRKGTR